MSHSEALKDLLFKIRQHPAFTELQKAVEPPAKPDFKPNSPETAETFGAKSIFASGKSKQHQLWIDFLRGNTTSQQE